MRQAVAAVILIVVTLLSVLDGVCCPDGCTDDRSAEVHASHSSSDGACGFCTGTLGSSAPQELAPGAIVVQRIVAPRHVEPIDAPHDPLDHPPRA